MHTANDNNRTICTGAFVWRRQGQKTMARHEGRATSFPNRF
jgi:hypothetical protein